MADGRMGLDLPGLEPKAVHEMGVPEWTRLSCGARRSALLVVAQLGVAPLRSIVN